MPRRVNPPAVNGSQALYILEKLIDEGAVTAADIRRHLSGMWTEMTVLEKRIAELRGVAASVHPVRRAKRIVQRVAKRVKRAAKTPEAQASRKLQGQYIAYIRQLPKRARKEYSAIAASDGREAAIDAIKKRLGR